MAGNRKLIAVRVRPDLYDFAAERADANDRPVAVEVKDVLMRWMRGELAAGPAGARGRPAQHRCGPALVKGQAHPAYRGVTAAANGNWRAKAHRKSLGTFHTDWEAAMAVDRALRETTLPPEHPDAGQPIEVNFPTGANERTITDAYQWALRVASDAKMEAARLQRELEIEGENRRIADQRIAAVLRERDAALGKLNEALARLGEDAITAHELEAECGLIAYQEARGEVSP